MVYSLYDDNGDDYEYAIDDIVNNNEFNNMLLLNVIKL